MLKSVYHKNKSGTISVFTYVVIVIAMMMYSQLN